MPSDDVLFDFTDLEVGVDLVLLDHLIERTEYDPETGCLLWTRGLSHGYGIMWLDGRSHRAHRVMYSLFVEIPDVLVLDHLCRRTACINPDHLELVTLAENNLRGEGCMADYARRTHCPKGHPYAGDNLWYTPWSNGGRCQECKRVENARTQAKRKARLAESRADQSET